MNQAIHPTSVADLTDVLFYYQNVPCVLHEEYGFQGVNELVVIRELEMHVQKFAAVDPAEEWKGPQFYEVPAARLKCVSLRDPELCLDVETQE